MPILAVTASFSQEDKVRCLEVGMNDILPKPFTKNDVLAAVNRNLLREK